jgi:hypothetical protein
MKRHRNLRRKFILFGNSPIKIYYTQSLLTNFGCWPMISKGADYICTINSHPFLIYILTFLYFPMWTTFAWARKCTAENQKLWQVLHGAEDIVPALPSGGPHAVCNFSPLCQLTFSAKLVTRVTRVTVVTVVTLVTLVTLVIFVTLVTIFWNLTLCGGLYVVLKQQPQFSLWKYYILEWVASVVARPCRPLLVSLIFLPETGWPT